MFFGCHYFDKKYLGTIDDYSVPNFVDIAKAYGIKARKIDNISKLEIELKDIFLFTLKYLNFHLDFSFDLCII